MMSLPDMFYSSYTTESDSDYRMIRGTIFIHLLLHFHFRFSSYKQMFTQPFPPLLSVEVFREIFT